MYMIPFDISFCSHGDGKGENPQKTKLREIFNRLTGEKNVIDAEELQDILTMNLKKCGYILCVFYLI